MKKNVHFNKTDDTNALDTLKSTWLNSLTAPQDGMWEALTSYAVHWEINAADKSIGYACIDGENRLLQFYLLPEWMQEGKAIFQQFIQENNIETALIGTNNPICLSIALHLQKSVAIHTYLFTNYLTVNHPDREGSLNMAQQQDLEKLVNFCHLNMGGPVEWLKGYLGDLIEKEELFAFEKEGEVIGTCEVRKSISNPEVADIGMIVSAAHRRKGWGTFLLGKAKTLALQRNRQAICSCEKDNLGSLKSIQNNGFRSQHQLLLLTF